MKGLLAVVFVVVSAVAEPPAPYAPSGWRPDGPAFVLPQRGQFQPEDYQPSFDPRNPSIPAIPSNEYGVPDDVSVQGLPTVEQQPIFQVSPINGQQNQGATFNSDIRNLDQGFKQNQYQAQQQNYQTFQRQKELEAQAKTRASNLPSPQTPRQFARTTPRPKTTEATTETPSKQVTEANVNEREILEDDSSPAKLQQKTAVEITRQNIQQYPGELYLASLAQLQLQPQFVPLQQIRDAQQLQVVPKGFDGPAHFAALPSVLAQQQLTQQPLVQGPQLLIGEQAPSNYVVQAQYQPAYQTEYQQPIAVPQTVQTQAVQTPAVQPTYLAPNNEAVNVPVQYQPAYQQSYQPQQYPQLQAQPVILQPQQINQPQFAQPAQEPESNREEVETIQPQVYQTQNGYQPQPAFQQPQPAFQQPQPAFQQPLPAFQQPQPAFQQPQYQTPIIVQQPNQYQAQLFPGQLISQDQYYQQQFQAQQQGQDALQSGLTNQDGNDIGSEESGEDEGSTATAVATVFGARTQPRVLTQYGAPYPAPKQQASGSATTTESPVEEVTEDGPAIAQAVAVSNGGRRKSSKLRSRRIRPVFTLDRSGHLVLAQEQ